MGMGEIISILDNVNVSVNKKYTNISDSSNISDCSSSSYSNYTSDSSDDIEKQKTKKIRIPAPSNNNIIEPQKDDTLEEIKRLQLLKLAKDLTSIKDFPNYSEYE